MTNDSTQLDEDRIHRPTDDGRLQIGKIARTERADIFRSGPELVRTHLDLTVSAVRSVSVLHASYPVAAMQAWHHAR